MNKALVMCAITMALSGCASVFDPSGASGDFSCTDPNNPNSTVEGVTCKTPFAIYKSTNGPAEIKESDLPIGVTLADYDAERRASKAASAGAASAVMKGVYEGQTYRLPGQMEPQDQAKTVRPVRVPATVMRIWIAPWIDSHDDLHFPTHIYTEIQPRRWAFGEAEFVGAGVTLPTKDLASVPARPVQQDGRQPQHATQPLKPYEPQGTGGQMPKLP